MKKIILILFFVSVFVKHKLKLERSIWKSHFKDVPNVPEELRELKGYQISISTFSGFKPDNEEYLYQQDLAM